MHVAHYYSTYVCTNGYNFIPVSELLAGVAEVTSEVG